VCDSSLSYRECTAHVTHYIAINAVSGYNRTFRIRYKKHYFLENALQKSWIASKNLSETDDIIRITKRNIFENVQRSTFKVPAIFVTG